jgi:hypothetical protein
MRVFTWLAALCVALLLAAYFVFEIIIRSTVLKQQLLEYIFRAYGRTLESFPHPMSYYLASLDRVLSSVQHTVSLSNPQFWTFVLPVTLGLLVIHFCIRFPYTTLPKVFLVIVMFLTLGMNYWGQNLPSLIPSSSYFDDTPPAARLMRKRSKGFDQNRFVLVGGELLGRSLSGRAGEPPTPQESILAVRDLLMNETGTAYGLAALDGYEPLRSLRQNLLITTVFATHLNRAVDLVAVKNGAPLDEDQNQNSAIYKKITPEEKAVDVVEKLPLLSMMNVKYLISLYPLKSPELTLLAPLHIERPYLDYYVYENRSVMPRLYFANNPLFFTGTERALFIALLETKDFTKKTFIECAECVPSPLGKGVAHAVRTENGLLVASTTSTTGGWLVYSETSLPGWIAQVDGARVPIHTANFLFQAIFVPKGEHIIEFRYVGSFALFLEKYGIRKL